MFLRLCFLVPLIVSSCGTISQEPRNLSDLKSELVEYERSGKYTEDLAASVASAKAFLHKRSAAGEKKLSVVFDIDETVLSNIPHMEKADWGYQPASWDSWVATAKGPALGPVREIYQTAIALDMHVFFLTGRKEKDRTATVRNLRAQGMGKFDRLILRPDSGTASQEKAVTFKTRVRRDLSEEGYTIIASFGDQRSDLEGGFAERTYKIPNPFYQID